MSFYHFKLIITYISKSGENLNEIHENELSLNIIYCYGKFIISYIRCFTAGPSVVELAGQAWSCEFSKGQPDGQRGHAALLDSVQSTNKLGIPTLS